MSVYEMDQSNRLKMAVKKTDFQILLSHDVASKQLLVLVRWTFALVME